ncbi:MAG: NAD-dependent epimerase/dehydratase family protein [Promethearchaeota archaeon]
MNSLYKKKVLITGGGGMIGRSLVKLLLKKNAKVTITDLTIPTHLPKSVNFVPADLRYFDVCQDVCYGMDYVFNLVGIKGSPKMCAEQPADFMVPMLQFNTNMMEAARLAKVKWYLYTSSVGVYQPAEIFKEEDVWKTFPSPNDRFAGWAKRMGELQAEAYLIQYNWNGTSIVRPANVYGRYDNFDPENAMVIPSLIRKAYENKVLEVWGDGSPIRDFIHADDVARGMIFVVENEITEPINLGSGDGVTIKEIAQTIASKFVRPIKWLTDKPSGDLKRVFDMSKANWYGFYPKISIEDGIQDTIVWFLKNKEDIDKRYNVFKDH